MVQGRPDSVESRLERSRTLPVNTRVPVPLDHPYTSPLWGAPVTPSRNNIRLTTADTFTSTLDGNAPGQCFHTRVSRKPVTLGRTVRPLLHSSSEAPEQDTQSARRADPLPLPLPPPPPPWQLTPVLRPTPGQDYSTFKPSALLALGLISTRRHLRPDQPDACATILHEVPSTGNHSTTNKDGSDYEVNCSRPSIHYIEQLTRGCATQDHLPAGHRSVPQPATRPALRPNPATSFYL
ncbi:hypothetical protein O3P69_017421 [Scylla paramamosain]|uniref:Uncharacterized protein n=1 Tax=Scylla paramamosain TaxID=85552 RepID=A0AAW0TVH4_SCYPA